MMRKKQAAKTKPKAAQVRQIAVGYKHRSSPLFISRLPTQLKGDDNDGYLRGDPYLPNAKVQYIHKNDYSTAIYTNKFCVGEKEFSESKGGGEARNIHRLTWIPPLVVRQADSGNTKGAVQGDQRGVFADIGKTRVAFKNVTKQPVKIMINSPRGRISDPSQCYLRRFKREFVIRPGHEQVFTATWGDKANIFTPMVTTVELGTQKPYDKLQGFVVADFAIIVPDVDEMSGKTKTELDQQDAVRVTFSQRYIATASYGSAGTAEKLAFVQRKPFYISSLNSFRDMIAETPVSLAGPRLPMGEATIGQFAKRYVVLCDGLPVELDELEGRDLVLHGVPLLFKVMGGNVVVWDHVNDGPCEKLVEPYAVLPGMPIEILPGELKISLGDIISALTTVTEILSIVAMFI